MKTIAMFDTSQGTLNQGDFIIAKSIRREMDYLTQSNVVLRFPTHNPLARSYQALFGDVRKEFASYNLKFLCGTNLFKATLLRPNRDWNIGLFDSVLYEGSISLGCGMEMNAPKVNLATKNIYRKILSKEYIHSTRDERTACFLRELGFRAINTGCPTTWSLTQDGVDRAFLAHSDTVLMTLTDYATDKKLDYELFRFLKDTYSKIVFWPQGSSDYMYAKQLGIIEEVEILPPSFEAYDAFQSHDFEYVGTRLHGGIYALTHGHKSIVLSVDHRAPDIAATTGIPVVARGNLVELEKYIKSDIAPKINVPHDAIDSWKKQFI